VRPLQNASNRHTGEGDCVAIGENSFKIVIPAKAGIQKLLKLLDSPVSSTGQAQSRASLARNDKLGLRHSLFAGMIRNQRYPVACCGVIHFD